MRATRGCRRKRSEACGRSVRMSRGSRRSATPTTSIEGHELSGKRITLDSLLLPDEHRGRLEVEVGDPRAEDLTPPGAGVGRQGDHRVEEGMASVGPDELQQLPD